MPFPPLDPLPPLADPVGADPVAVTDPPADPVGADADPVAVTDPAADPLLAPLHPLLPPLPHALCCKK